MHTEVRFLLFVLNILETLICFLTSLRGAGWAIILPEMDLTGQQVVELKSRLDTLFSLATQIREQANTIHAVVYTHGR
jgi:hypothetical protein